MSADQIEQHLSRQAAQLMRAAIMIARVLAAREAAARRAAARASSSTPAPCAQSPNSSGVSQHRSIVRHAATAGGMTPRSAPQKKLEQSA